MKRIVFLIQKRDGTRLTDGGGESPSEPVRSVCVKV